MGLRVRVECQDPGLRRDIVANFAAMTAASEGGAPDLDYQVAKDAARDTFGLACQGTVIDDGLDAGDLLFALEKSLTVELQKRRPDLFFLHAAALERNGVAFLMAAASGSGKSTAAWGMLHHECRYLSDELCPIDLDTMRVFPYPHALCLKQDPPAPYALPANTLRLGRTLHVPVADLPAPAVSEPVALGAVFLVTHRPDIAAPEMHAIGPAEAGARLYVNALNALAHRNQGLEAAARIAQHVPCFALSSARLAPTCALVRATVDAIASSGRDRRAGPGESPPR